MPPEETRTAVPLMGNTGILSEQGTFLQQNGSYSFSEDEFSQ